MVRPKICGLFCQAMPDTMLKHHNYSLYLPIGFTVANSDVVVDNAQPFLEPCKASHKLGAIVCPDVVWLAPKGNQVIIQELGGPPAV